MLAACGPTVAVETTDGGAAGAPTCDPEDVFVGSDGCYPPDPACCPEVGAMDLVGTCSSATSDAMPAAYVCATVPPLGGPHTDYRDCQPIDADLPCALALLCCEP